MTEREQQEQQFVQWLREEIFRIAIEAAASQQATNAFVEAAMPVLLEQFRDNALVTLLAALQAGVEGKITSVYGPMLEYIDMSRKRFEQLEARVDALENPWRSGE